MSAAATKKAKIAKGYVGRFAPSPSGPLHVGSLFTALASYVDAKQAGGKWLVRIEDIDEHRTAKGAPELIIRTLETYGFMWDGTVEVQSLRKSLYRSALTKLSESEHVFVCKCSRKSLIAEPVNISGEPHYPGTCLDAGYVDFGHVAKRFIVEGQSVKWNDLHFGAQKQDLEKDVGDFIVRRTDGLFSYQLAVVVDDADQGVTRVVRGADLMSSTARQIAIQKALDLPTPEYLHLPVLVDGRGEKLSKTTLAAAVPISNPMPVLLTVWKLLGQEMPATAYTQPADFLKFAVEHWDAKLLPRMMTVPFLVV
jgi:glutamyl-Q tRNA(Asp) synthetase